MSASREEIQTLANQILDCLGSRIRSGQMVIHFSDAVVQRVEINTVHKPIPQPLRRPVLIAVDTASR